MFQPRILPWGSGRAGPGLPPGSARLEKLPARLVAIRQIAVTVSSLYETLLRIPAKAEQLAFTAEKFLGRLTHCHVGDFFQVGKAFAGCLKVFVSELPVGVLVQVEATDDWVRQPCSNIV